MTEKEKDYQKVQISEFFERNKHILGFDNPTKAIMTCLKEFCDNSLDACEDEGILPQLDIEISKKPNGRYYISFKDNGPGIPHNVLPRVFGKLLFGSKFHVNRQKRGKQGRYDSLHSELFFCTQSNHKYKIRHPNYFILLPWSFI